MKKILIILGIILLSVPVFATSGVNVNFDDGIYHIVLSGDKIKKQISQLLFSQ